MRAPCFTCGANFLRMPISSVQSGDIRKISAAKLSAGDLRQAFQVFDDASRHLAGSYQELQAEVERLGMELVAANARLNAQLAEKASLVGKLTELLEVLPVGVLVLDEGGVIAEANAAAQSMLGDTLTGRHWQSIRSGLLGTAEGGDDWLCGATGRMVSLTVRHLRSGSGRLVVAVDVTESHAAQKALQRSRRLAGMGATSASLAHQLRTPLAVAMLYASRLVQGAHQETPVMQMAAAVVGQLRELETFIHGSLAFARGGAVWDAAVDLVRLSSEAAKMMRSQPGSMQTTLSVTAQVGILPVAGCRTALLSMLINLLDNALKACAGGGAVTVELARAQAQAVIRVTDNGCGMSEEIRRHLFEPYFTTRHDGHGLGLAFVLNVVTAHRGRIDVESGGGFTVFTVKLPLSESVG